MCRFGSTSGGWAGTGARAHPALASWGFLVCGMTTARWYDRANQQPVAKGDGLYGAQVESNMLNYDLTPAKWASGNSTMRFSVEN